MFEEKEELMERLRLAEDRQTPDYLKFREKIEEIERENKNLKEIVKKGESSRMNPIKRSLSQIEMEKELLLDNLKRVDGKGVEYNNLNKKINELEKKEKNLQRELLENQDLDNDKYFKKALESLKNENKGLTENLKRAEDKQTPEYHKFKGKMEKLEKENKTLKEIIEMGENNNESIAIKNALNKLMKEKDKLLDNLAAAEGVSQKDPNQYYELNRKINELEENERALNRELLKVTQKGDPLLKKAIKNIENENENLKEKMGKMEEKQGPNYKNFKERLEDFENENRNLREVIKKSKPKNRFLEPLKEDLDKIQEQKMEIIDNLKRVPIYGEDYKELSSKLEEIKEKEKKLNEDLLNGQQFREDPALKKAIGQLMKDKQELEENLKRAEDHQTPEYHKFKLKLDKLTRENENMKDALLLATNPQEELVREQLKTLNKEKANYLEDLSRIPPSLTEEDNREYIKLQKKLKEMEEKGDELNEELLKAQEYKLDPLVKAAIQKLRNENSNLFEDMKTAEMGQNEAYARLKEKYEERNRENGNLKEALKMKNKTVEMEKTTAKIADIQEKKNEALNVLKNLPIDGPEFKKFNAKVEDLKEKEKELNKILLKESALKMEPEIRNAVENLKGENMSLIERLAKAESLQSPEFRNLTKKISKLEREKDDLKEILAISQKGHLSEPIRETINKLKEEKQDIINEMKKQKLESPEYFGLNSKLGEIKEKEKELNEELLNAQQYRQDPLLKKAIVELQEDKNNLELKLKAAEDLQTPDYIKFKQKLENLEKENMNLKDIVNVARFDPETEKIRYNLEMINEEKSKLMDNLKKTKDEGRDYDELVKKIEHLQKREKDLNEDLLVAHNEKNDPQLKKAIMQLQKEKNDLEEHLVRAEDRQTPEYMKFKNKLEKLENANNVLKDVLEEEQSGRDKERSKKHARIPPLQTPILESLDKVKEEKMKIFESLGKTSFESPEYYHMNKKIEDLQKVEKELNSKLLKSPEYISENPHLKEAIQSLQNDNKKLNEKLEFAEELQGDDYHKLREKNKRMENELNFFRNKEKGVGIGETYFPFKEDFEKLKEEKGEILEQLKQKKDQGEDSSEYQELKAKLRELKSKERQFNEDLLLEQEYNPRLKKAVQQLQQENYELKEHLRRAEDRQTPDYHKFKQKLSEITEENSNLKEVIEKIKEDSSSSVAAKAKNLNKLQKEKENLLQDLQGAQVGTEQFNELNKQINQLKNKEKKLNEELVDAYREQEQPQNSPHIMKMVKNLQTENEELKRSLKLAEEKHSPDYRKLKDKILDLEDEKKNMKEAMEIIQTSPQIAHLNRNLAEIKKEKENLLNDLSLTSPDNNKKVEVIHKKINELSEQEDVLNQELARSPDFREVAQLKKAVRHLQAEKDKILDALNLAEQLNTRPENYKLFKTKIEHLQSEKKNLEDALIGSQLNPKIAPIRRNLNKIEEEKEDLLRNLKKTDLDSHEYEKINQELLILNAKEKDLEEELAEDIIFVPELKLINANLKNQNKDLKEKLKLAEDTQTPEYIKFNDKLNKCQQENKNLREALKLNSEDSADITSFKKSLNKLKEEKIHLLEEIQNVPSQSSTYLQLNQKIGEIGRKEKDINEKIISSHGFNDIELLKNNYKEIKEDNQKLKENLKRAEDLQTPDYHKFKHKFEKLEAENRNLQEIAKLYQEIPQLAPLKKNIRKVQNEKEDLLEKLSTAQGTEYFMLNNKISELKRKENELGEELAKKSNYSTPSEMFQLRNVIDNLMAEKKCLLENLSRAEDQQTPEYHKFNKIIKDLKNENENLKDMNNLEINKKAIKNLNEVQEEKEKLIKHIENLPIQSNDYKQTQKMIKQLQDKEMEINEEILPTSLKNKLETAKERNFKLQKDLVKLSEKLKLAESAKDDPEYFKMKQKIDKLEDENENLLESISKSKIQPSKNELKKVVQEKQQMIAVLDNLPKYGDQYNDMNKKIAEKMKQEKELIEEINKTETFAPSIENQSLKKVIDQLHQEKKELEENLKIAEDTQTPDYLKFKDKLLNAEKDKKNLLEIIEILQESPQSIPLKSALNDIQVVKKEAFQNLEKTQKGTPEHYILSQKINEYLKKEKDLADELEKVRGYNDEGSQYKKIIVQLQNEKKQLQDKLELAENLQTPDYHILNNKIKNLEEEKENLLEALKAKKIDPKVLPLTKDLNELKEREASLLEKLKRTPHRSSNYNEINKELSEIKDNEKRLNEELLITQKQNPYVQEMIEQFQKERAYLMERLDLAEDLQTPEYHRMQAKIHNLEEENLNLLKALRKPVGKDNAYSNLLNNLNTLENEKADLLDKLGKSDTNSPDYKLINQKITDLKKKENELNENLAKRDNFDDLNKLKKAYAIIQKEKDHLLEQLKYAEDLQTPEYLKFKNKIENLQCENDNLREAMQQGGQEQDIEGPLKNTLRKLNDEKDLLLINLQNSKIDSPEYYRLNRKIEDLNLTENQLKNELDKRIDYSGYPQMKRKINFLELQNKDLSFRLKLAEEDQDPQYTKLREVLDNVQNENKNLKEALMSKIFQFFFLKFTF